MDAGKQTRPATPNMQQPMQGSALPQTKETEDRPERHP